MRLQSRRNNSFNFHYPLIVEALGELPQDTVVDGEVVALDESGFPNFSLLQNYRSEASRIHFFVFDLLVYQGRDIACLPLFERRKRGIVLRQNFTAIRQQQFSRARHFQVAAATLV